MRKLFIATTLFVLAGVSAAAAPRVQLRAIPATMLRKILDMALSFSKG